MCPTWQRNLLISLSHEKSQYYCVGISVYKEVPTHELVFYFCVGRYLREDVDMEKKTSRR